MDLLLLFIATVLVNNFVLTYFLGICPFLGVSNKIDSAIGMGMAVIFVMVITSIVTFGINHFVLMKFNMPYLKIVSFIVVIASLVQLVEMYMEKHIPALYNSLGIFLPLITTNCAIMGLALWQAQKEFNFIQGLVYSLGAGGGFTLALVMMAGIREKLETAEVPKALQGASITLISAGIMAMIFMAFAGLIKV